MKKILKVVILLVAIVATFWYTMNNLHITVNTEEKGQWQNVLVKCGITMQK